MNRANPLQITLTFKNAEDLKDFRRYKEKTDQTDSTVGGPIHGVMCSALKRATIDKLPDSP